MPDPEVHIERTPVPPHQPPGLTVAEKLEYLEAAVIDLQVKVTQLEGKWEWRQPQTRNGKAPPE